MGSGRVAGCRRNIDVFDREATDSGSMPPPASTKTPTCTHPLCTELDNVTTKLLYVMALLYAVQHGTAIVRGLQYTSSAIKMCRFYCCPNDALLCISAAHAMAPCVSFRPSVCLDVCHVHVLCMKTVKRIATLFTFRQPDHSSFSTRVLWRHSDGDPITVASNAGGV